ncbi:MAG: type IV pilin protein [Planctomycetota bacterium]|jgi:prepilin-type N-terminal cleavage/methylation domain-containing protein
MKSTKGFTLVEMMVVILIVAILAAVAIPILRGRIDSAKWSEGRAMVGTIATCIRAYHGLNGPYAPVPTTLGPGPTGLGFIPGDLRGTYFVDADFAFNVTSMNPLEFTVTCTPTVVDLDPPSYTLNQDGIWTP